MCGIILVISKINNDIIDVLLNGLSLIQNRGYDSVGIAYIDNKNNNYNLIKYGYDNNIDCFKILKNNIINENIISNIGFGHTRWATHGSKTKNNAHPHISYNKKFILVHNGIINNYLVLKKFLIDNNYKFYSDTDTEVIVNIIEYYFLYDTNCNNNIEKCINKINNILEGTWALVIVNTDDINNVYITRHGSPLLLGYNDNIYMCASEVSGFSNYIMNYIVLKNNDIIKICKNNYISINSNNYNIENVSLNNVVNTCHPYEHWTLKEIFDQPYFINSAINNGGRILNNKIKLGGLDQLCSIYNNMNNIKYIMLFGCGTSYHACLMSKYYFKNINIIVIDACEFTENDIPLINKNEMILSIFCSQSGETIDIVKCIDICNKYNCITYGIVNIVDSLITRLVSHGTYINAGREIGVASTKSFTNTLIILSLIAIYFNNDNKFILENNKILDNIRLLSNNVKELLNNENINKEINKLSQLIVEKIFNNIFIIGKNKLYIVSKEISLKIKEICYIHAEAYSSSSLKHGPFALLDNTNLTILLIDYYDKNNLKLLESTYNEIVSRNTNIIIVSNNINIKNILVDKDNIIQDILIIPYMEYYNEILFTVILQLLSYNISIKKNINPDRPRNLAKVVTVE